MQVETSIQVEFLSWNGAIGVVRLNVNMEDAWDYPLDVLLQAIYFGSQGWHHFLTCTHATVTQIQTWTTTLELEWQCLQIQYSQHFTKHVSTKLSSKKGSVMPQWIFNSILMHFAFPQNHTDVSLPYSAKTRSRALPSGFLAASRNCQIRNQRGYLYWVVTYSPTIYTS